MNEETASFTDQLLALLLHEARQALSSTDPLERVRGLAAIQRYAGWALHWSVTGARERGVSWQRLAAAMGMSQHTTLQRQYMAAGPVVTVRAFHQAGTRNDDLQTPLRQAATRLANAMFPTESLQGSPTGQTLYPAVQALASALTNPDAQPLLTATKHVLAKADELIQRTGYPAAATLEQERTAWTELAVLRATYERDQTLIEAADAARLAAAARNGAEPSADTPAAPPTDTDAPATAPAD